MNDMDILFFSRGRGKGHAMPDLAITHHLRRLRPKVRIRFVSYGTGAEVLSGAGESVLDLGLPDMVSFAELLVPVGALLRSVHPTLVVSHEESAVLPMAKIFGLPTVFLVHWFGAPQDPSMQALAHADEILFMEKKGVFPEPPSAKGKVQYLGPVLRNFEYRREHRDSVRLQMGLGPADKLILMLPGSWTEKMAASQDLVLQAFERLHRFQKRLIWVAGKDYDAIRQRTSGNPGIEVVGTDPNLNRLMAASDVAITKGTYATSKELAALGIPSISLSHGHNFIDDLFARSIPTNKFLWLQETDASTLADCIENAFENGLNLPDPEALRGEGAASVAAALNQTLAVQQSASQCGAVESINSQVQLRSFR